MATYGGTSRFLSFIGLIALSAYLSLFSGVAGIFIKKSLNSNLLSYLIIPFIWVSKDILIEKLFGGFPWCIAGYSQYKNIYFIQIAEIVGIHLITFFLIYFNILLYLLFKHKNKKLILVIIISFIFIYSEGYFLYKRNSYEIKDIKTHIAGIIQPNTKNDQNLNYREKIKKLEELFNDSKKLKEKGAEFIIWPEYTVSIYPLQNNFFKRKFFNFTNLNVPIFAGFTDLKNSKEIYNSIILFQKNKTEKYDKVHLTPFGEYIPFRKLLFFVKKITDEIGDFTFGKSVHNLKINSHFASTPICYEIIFPELIRKFISYGGELIITISNDSWFGDSSAPLQHLSMATFRSIENRRYILRSTSNGISAVISPSGEIIYQSSSHTKDTFVAKFKYLTKKTFFTRYGYMFPYFCIILVVIYFIKIKFFTKNKKSKTV
jgi:apolipoprotein N-acyltransferase